MKGKGGKFFSGVDIRGMIKEAAEIADAAPGKYSQKTFEVLLSTMCQQKNGKKLTDTRDSKYSEERYKWNTEIKTFMGQFDITEDQITKHCFHISEDGRASRKYKLKKESAAKIQIDVACIHALKNALESGLFEFSMEAVRDECKSMDRLNEANFRTYFKNKKIFFESLEDKEHVSLSFDGKEKLRDLINELSDEG